MIEDFIKENRDDIIKNIQELIQIPSVYKESSNPKYPFGEAVNNALEYALNLGKSMGFRTKNIDGYCGYIEFGGGNELVGIIGHLDVVPEGENWTYPPFSGTVSNECIFGRGAIDDKGPVISSLYAMKYVMDNCKVNKRVRLILGLNEENDWKCIEYYKANEEIPSIGFSPDADFPCIYAEKTVLTQELKTDISQFEDKNIKIKNIDCNNNAVNVVPKICSVVLNINPDKINIKDFIYKIKTIVDELKFEIDIYKIDEEEIKLTSYGISAHAAHPDLGVNSISRLIIVLDKIFKLYGYTIDLFDFFTNYINTQFNGENLGINFEDESGKLTLNVGYFGIENNFMKIKMNLRVPVHTDITDIGSVFMKNTSTYPNLDFDISNYMPGLYIDPNSKLVQSLCNIYNEETNSNCTPIAIGGATFARAFPNCISFGANFPGNKDMCHQTDEFIKIDNLLLSCKIYAKAIIFLTNEKKGF